MRLPGPVVSMAGVLNVLMVDPATPTGASKARLFHRMAESECLAGRWGAAHAALDKALTAAGGAGSPDSAAFLLTRADVFEREGRLEESLATVRAALESDPPPRLRARLLNLAGAVLLRNGKVAEAGSHHEKAWRLVEHVEDAARERLQARLGLARVHYLHGDYRRAREVLQDALRHHRSRGDQGDAAKAFHAMTAIQTSCGDTRRAIEAAESALRLSEELGDVMLQAGSHSNLGYLYRLRGNHPRARKHLGACLDLTERHGLSFRGALASCNLAALEMEEGHLDAARHAVERAMKDLPKEEAWAQAWTYRRMAELHLALGDTEDGLAWAGKAEATAREHDYFPLLAGLDTLRGVAIARQGRWEEARACFAGAMHRLREHPDPDELAEHLFRKGEALLGHDDGAEGRKALIEARAIAQERGGLLRVHRIDALLKSAGGPSADGSHRR